MLATAETLRIRMGGFPDVVLGRPVLVVPHGSEGTGWFDVHDARSGDLLGQGSTYREALRKATGRARERFVAIPEPPVSA